jgi:hypothetical protein
MNASIITIYLNNLFLEFFYSFATVIATRTVASHWPSAMAGGAGNRHEDPTTSLEPPRRRTTASQRRPIGRRLGSLP